MRDLIYRQMAIDVVSEGCQEWRGIFERCEEKLLALPSAEPERKSKKCVWCDSPYRIEYYWIDREGCTASFQDEERHIVATGIANYCPNCGADMRGEE